MLNTLRRLLGRRGKKPSGPPVSSSKPSTSAGGGKPRVQHGPTVTHSPISENDLDPDAVKIVRRLTRFDHTAYLVGGCVRDLLLDRRPKDFDIGTSATPRQVKRIFRNSRIIGRRFRLAHIYFQNRKIIEVATFRAMAEQDQPGEDRPADEGQEKDLLIRDDNVFGTLEEDALRRDFTINQLFYDLVGQNVIDHADGLADLRRRYVRTIGDPSVRFREDPIRILRAIKFAARLDFKIEDGTLAALKAAVHEIPKAAPPRVLEEINRFCAGGASRRSFELLRETGVLDVILPEFAGHYRRDRDAVETLDKLLTAMDRRTADGREAETGEILAVLAVPILFERLGWKRNGTASWPQGVDMHRVVDDLIRPLAQRLRISRKDQELCRTLVMTLFRMVPHGKTRPNVRRAILSRECLPSALWILTALGEMLGGEFKESAAIWGREPRGSGGEGEGRQTGDRPAGAGRSRSSRRRRSRGGRKGEESGGEKETRGKSESQARKPAGKKTTSPPKPDPNMPSPWSDNYFFAALPTVPEGADAPAPETEDRPAEDQPSEETTATDRSPEDGDEAPPKKKRRRRRRRRKPAGEPTDQE